MNIIGVLIFICAILCLIIFMMGLVNWALCPVIKEQNNLIEHLKSISTRYFVWHSLIAYALRAKIGNNEFVYDIAKGPHLTQNELFDLLDIARDVEDNKAHYDYDNGKFGYNYEDKDIYISPYVDWI